MVKSGTRIQGLDVIRGVAIALVMLRHAWPSTFTGAGIVGVAIFFVLSGHLITGILAGNIEKRGRVDYKRFYVNRALRLLPALALLLLVFTIGEILMGPSRGLGHLLAAVGFAGVYLTDFVPHLAYPGIDHLWTLSVEEQFYLLWPAILLLLVRRRWLKRGLALAVVAAVALCAISVLVESQRSNLVIIYTLPTSWAVALIIGCASYLYRDRVASLLGRAAGWWALLAIAFLGAFCFFPDAKTQPITYLLGIPMVALCTVVVINVVKRWERIPTRLLEPLRALGIISYGAYLWTGPMTHWPIEVSPWTSIPLTIGAATISWWTVERFALAWKARLAAKAAAQAAEQSTAGADAPPVHADSPSVEQSA